MQKIIFEADEETVLKSNEVVTLRSKNHFVSIWLEDKITVHLRTGEIYTGQVVWSIEPWCISVQYTPSECIRFAANSIKKIEILEYSNLRPLNDRGNTGVIA